LTVHEYMNAQRFPLTTQKGMPPLWQLMHDARTLDYLAAILEGGGQLTDTQQRRLKELQDKAAAHPPLVAEVHRCRVWRQGSGEKRDGATRTGAEAEPIAASAAPAAGAEAGLPHRREAGAGAR
jgi:hypothetical protein